MGTCTVLAVGCHPDDIEFMMGGTLLLLKSLDAELHYMNLANGSCGTVEHSVEEIVRIRETEARQAASYLGAHWHPSIANDLEVIYAIDLVRKTAAVVRSIAPDIILVPALRDYMEDHMHTARIVLTAAFARAMPNFRTIPAVPPVRKETAVYHALPYGLQDGLGNRASAHFYVDITQVIDNKEAMLAMHRSQRNWLDESQLIDSYLQTMRDMSSEVGQMAGGTYTYAEGWVRHNSLGYAAVSFTPLEDMLKEQIQTQG